MIWAWLGALVVGLTLGLLGAGGAILTVPILVFLVGHDEKSAIAEALAIVSAVAIVGMLRAAAQGKVDFKNAIFLSIPGIFGAWLGAHTSQFVSGAVQLVILSALMLTAAYLMFKSSGGSKSSAPGGPPSAAPIKANFAAVALVLVQGLALGFATGFVGVGGGFLIVPVLVLIRKLPMAVAVGTSLAIISVNSGSGFLKYFAMSSSGESVVRIDWTIVAIFIAVAVVGTLIGNAIAGKMPQRALKRTFAVFLVVMAIYIAIRQAPKAFPNLFPSQNATASLR